MSEASRVIVVRVPTLTKHENADSLSVGEIDGCPFVVNHNDTKEDDLRLFCQFDINVPDRPDMPEWVRGKRIKPCRLRGVFSMAALLPLDESWGSLCEGDDVTDQLGFTKYDAELEREKQERDGVITDPSGLHVPYYDLENLRKYHSYFVVGEPVIITEKLEGENIAIVYSDGKFHLRTRTRWLEDGENKWWKAFHKYDWEWLTKTPGLVAFGEKYGNVNKFRYDCVDGEQKIAIFDLYDAIRGEFRDCPTEFWSPYNDTEAYLNMCDCVPVLYKGEYEGLDHCKVLTDGNSVLANHILEGIVIEPMIGRTYGRGSRLKLKLHGEKYLIMKGKSSKD